jgi:uncharacterized membrane protein
MGSPLVDELGESLSSMIGRRGVSSLANIVSLFVLCGLLFGCTSLSDVSDGPLSSSWVILTLLTIMGCASALSVSVVCSIPFALLQTEHLQF